MAESIIKRNYQKDVVVNEVTGNANLAYSALIQYLFAGFTGNHENYYIKQGSRLYQPFSINGVYVCVDAESTVFGNVIFRVINSIGGFYEGNGTFTLTNSSSASTAGQTFQLIRRAGT